MKANTYLLALLLPSFASSIWIVKEPFAFVLEEPKEHAHIEDGLPYGTRVELVEEQGIFAHVSYPERNGWVYKNALLDIENHQSESSHVMVGPKGAYLFSEADTEFGPFLHLPFETLIKVIEELPEQHNRWLKISLPDGQIGYIQRSQLYFSSYPLSMDEMVAFSKQFLGIKYLWGGTTSFGYDCSGFVKMLYRQMGISLPRDAHQQAADPRFVSVDPKDAKKGDLIFFTNNSGKVVHVGMMVDDSHFIHAFTKEESWVCMSSLQDERFKNGYFYYSLFLKRLS